jgi:hypothetical protein
VRASSTTLRRTLGNDSLRALIVQANLSNSEVPLASGDVFTGFEGFSNRAALAHVESKIVITRFQSPYRHLDTEVD